MTDFATERLLLRPFTVDDADFVWDMYSRWEVQRYLGREPRVLADRAEAVAVTERLAAPNPEPHGRWAITDRSTGRPLGMVLLKVLPASGTGAPSGDTEVGWHLHPDVWGRGYATEAAGRLLVHAFDAGISEVLAVTYPANTASQRVARRLGMTHRGTTDAYYDVTCELFGVERAQAPG